MMFGGDEVGALVLDHGTSFSKVGFAGHDTPRAVFPTAAGICPHFEDVKMADTTVIGEQEDQELKYADSIHARRDTAFAIKNNKKYFVGEQSVKYRRDNMDIVRPIQDTLVQDWDSMETLWDYSFKKCLFVNPKEHPILLSEPPLNTKERREKTCEIMFEKFEVPAVFLCCSAVLSAFSVGRSIAVVVDTGGGLTTTVPVFEGFVIRKGVRRTRYAGELLDDVLEQCLLQHDTNRCRSITPRYLFRKELVREENEAKTFRVVPLTFPQTTPSYHRFMTMDIVRDIKENVLRVSESPFEISNSLTLPSVSYELPDGQMIEVGPDRFSVPELLFNPSHLDVSHILPNDVDAGFRFQGVHRMTQDTINSCDADIRRELYGNLVVSGGTSVIPGLCERLQKQLASLVSSAIKVRMQQTNTSIERQYAVWIGGSILASLGSFQQMWFSKSEYEEYGASLIDKKCP